MSTLLTGFVILPSFEVFSFVKFKYNLRDACEIDLIQWTISRKRCLIVTRLGVGTGHQAVNCVKFSF